MELEKRTPGKRRIYAGYISGTSSDKRTGKRADRRYIICDGPRADFHIPLGLELKKVNDGNKPKVPFKIKIAGIGR